jgi:uncharacterized membrane protein
MRLAAWQSCMRREAVMCLAPFDAAPSAIQLHLLAAVAAFVLGTWVLVRPKGTPVHRRLGRLWMALMACAALSSFFVPATIGRFLGPWGAIHILSVWVLVSVSVAIWAARSGRIRLHRYWVLGTYAGGLIGAGAGAFAPGRLLSHMLGYG